MIETLETISRDLGDCIAELYSDSGVMQQIKMKLKDQGILEWADYFIVYNLKMIEILGEERNEHEKRLKELRRARQDSAGDGDGDQVSERAGVYVAANVWNPQPGQVHGGVSGRGIDNNFGIHEEREDPTGTDIDGLFHQTELFPTVVQLRSPSETVSETVSDSATSFFTDGTESERDGLGGGQDLGGVTEIQLPVCVHRPPSLPVRPCEEQEPESGYRPGDPEAQGNLHQARDYDFSDVPHPATKGGRRGVRLREDQRQLLCGPGE
jgi:hypothetical protein